MKVGGSGPQEEEDRRTPRRCEQRPSEEEWRGREEHQVLVFFCGPRWRGRTREMGTSYETLPLTSLPHLLLLSLFSLIAVK